MSWPAPLRWQPRSTRWLAAKSTRSARRSDRPRALGRHHRRAGPRCDPNPRCRAPPPRSPTPRQQPSHGRSCPSNSAPSRHWSNSSRNTKHRRTRASSLPKLQNRRLASRGSCLLRARRRLYQNYRRGVRARHRLRPRRQRGLRARHRFRPAPPARITRTTSTPPPAGNALPIPVPPPPRAVNPAPNPRPPAESTAQAPVSFPVTATRTFGDPLPPLPDLPESTALRAVAVEAPPPAYPETKSLPQPTTAAHAGNGWCSKSPTRAPHRGCDRRSRRPDRAARVVAGAAPSSTRT